MKKITTSMMVLSVFSMSLYGYSTEERIADMQKMEAAMAQIQKGIPYNHQKMAIQGVEKLKEASANVQAAPKGDMDYSGAYAKTKAANIMKYADEVKGYMKKNRKHAATTNYTKILKECVSCHNKLRKWN